MQVTRKSAHEGRIRDTDTTAVTHGAVRQKSKWFSMTR